MIDGTTSTAVMRATKNITIVTDISMVARRLATERHQLGDGLPVAGDNKSLTGLDAIEHVARVVAQIADRDLINGDMRHHA